MACYTHNHVVCVSVGVGVCMCTSGNISMYNGEGNTSNERVGGVAGKV